jgi:DNA-binding NarL/FixJ family response regulator
MPPPTRGDIGVMIVDDHEVVRRGLVTTLRTLRRYSIVGAVSTAAEALEAARQLQPTIAIVDLRLPDMTGDELCRALIEQVPGIAVVMLSTYLDEGPVRAALVGGASAYVSKAAGLLELCHAIDRIVNGEQPSSAQQAPQIVRQLHTLIAQRESAFPMPLTPQEEKVLKLAAQGLTNHEIGERLFIAESTVRFHIQKLKGRFGARSKTDLIAKVIRSGLISPNEDDAGSP